MTNKELIEKLREGPPAHELRHVGDWQSILHLCDRLEAAEAEAERFKGLLVWLATTPIITTGVLGEDRKENSWPILSAFPYCPEKAEIQKILGEG